MVDECEGCINVGDVGWLRPKQVLTNTQNDRDQNTMKDYGVGFIHNVTGSLVTEWFRIVLNGGFLHLKCRGRPTQHKLSVLYIV